jgi:hypothetical protein
MSRNGVLLIEPKMYSAGVSAPLGSAFWWCKLKPTWDML